MFTRNRRSFLFKDSWIKAAMLALLNSGCSLDAALFDIGSVISPLSKNQIQIEEQVATAAASQFNQHIRYKITSQKPIKAGTLTLDDLVQSATAKGLIYNLTQGGSSSEYLLDVVISAKSGSVELSIGSGTVEFEDGEKNEAAQASATTRNNALTESKLANSEQHSCYIDKDRQVRCFGYYYGGQLGNGDTGGAEFLPGRLVNSTLITGTINFQKISAHDYGTCALNEDGKIYCWGDNYYKELGLGAGASNSIYIPTPTLVTNLTGDQKFIDLATGYQGTCGISSDEDLYCWGHSEPGLSAEPVKIDLTPLSALNLKVVQATVGGDHACGITKEGRLFCWGGNSYGQLGDNSQTNSTIPKWVDVSGMNGVTTFKNVSAGMDHTCAISMDEKLYCWGRNRHGQLGDGTIVDKLIPTAIDRTNIPADESIVKVVAKEEGSCVLSNLGKPYCFGYNWNYSTGNGSTADTVKAEQVDTSNLPADTSFVTLSKSSSLICGETNTGTVACWGYPYEKTSFRDYEAFKPYEISTAQLPAGQKWSAIAVNETGLINISALTTDGTAYSWGSNQYAMGNGLAISLTPAPVDTSGMTGATKFSKISANNAVTCGVATDGILYCWGSGYGIGQGSSTIISVDKPTPVVTTDMTGATTFSQVTVGTYVVCGIATDEVGYCWGGTTGSMTFNNPALGNGSSAVRFSPYPINVAGIPGSKLFSKIQVSRLHACGLMKDGKVYCWGNSNYNRSGNSTATSVYLPTLLDTSGMTGTQLFKDIQGDHETFCGITTDDKAYCWGDNSGGHLGNGLTVNSATPVELDTSNIVSAFAPTLLAGFGEMSCGVLDVNNNLYCWGRYYLPFDVTGNQLAPRLVDRTGVNGNFVSLEGGRNTVLGLTDTGNLYCFGYDCLMGLPRPKPKLQYFENF